MDFCVSLSQIVGTNWKEKLIDHKVEWKIRESGTAFRGISFWCCHKVENSFLVE